MFFFLVLDCRGQLMVILAIFQVSLQQTASYSFVCGLSVLRCITLSVVITIFFTCWRQQKATQHRVSQIQTVDLRSGHTIKNTNKLTHTLGKHLAVHVSNDEGFIVIAASSLKAFGPFWLIIRTFIKIPNLKSDFVCFIFPIHFKFKVLHKVPWFKYEATVLVFWMSFTVGCGFIILFEVSQPPNTQY